MLDKQYRRFNFSTQTCVISDFCHASTSRYVCNSLRNLGITMRDTLLSIMRNLLIRTGYSSRKMTPLIKHAIVIVVVVVVVITLNGCTTNSQDQNIEEGTIVHDAINDRDISSAYGSSEEESSNAVETSSGGKYSHHWIESGTVISVTEEELILQTEDDAVTLTIDTTQAIQYGRYQSGIEEGDEVLVYYFLYDRSGNSIIADSVSINQDNS